MDRETDAQLAGSRGETILGGTIGETVANQRGLDNRAGKGGSGGALLFAGPLVICLLACFWPLVGAGTILSVIIAQALLGLAIPNPSGIAMFMTMVISGGIGLYLSIKLERVLQRSRMYRILRHVTRLILLAAFFVYFNFQFKSQLYVPPEITLRWIDSQLSATAYAVIIVLLIAAHVLSRRLDERIEIWLKARRIAGVASYDSSAQVDAIADELAQDRAEERAVRRARRLKAGAIAGSIGAIFLVVIGEAAGSVLFGFFFFGFIGALLSRFLPRKRRIQPAV